ncbi:hypothetical protein ACFYPK_28085 [Streptomyces halstedii]|uniref:hypothetical protein n=1 Tax=Streptomyces halstedii TaxID=1944 RepID=UPI003460B656
MAFCRTCSRVIPCHCHITPAVQIRPGVYEASKPAMTPLTIEDRRRLLAGDKPPTTDK